MPSTYTTNLGIEKIATGEQSGTWGTTSNTNFDLIDEAVNGVEQVTLAAAGSSGSPNDLPITNGTSSDGRNKFIEFIDGGDLGGTAFVQLTPNDAEKVVHIRNSLSADRTITIFQGTYNASNDFVIPNGADVVLKFDGAGAGAVVSDVFVNLTPTKLTTAEADVTTGNITTVNATTVDTTNVEVTNLKAKDGTSAGSIADSTGVVTLASSVLTTTDINGGTIDGVTIGGASAGAGTFTTITGSGDMAIDTDTLFVDVSTDRVGINNNSPTTALDVTGTVTADGLTVDAGGVLSIGTNNAATTSDISLSGNAVIGAETSANITTGSGGFLVRTGATDASAGYSDGSLAFKVHDGGDISFYEDTGTTPLFFWDASAERLIIGDNTVTPAADAGDLVVGGSTGSNGITIGSATDGSGSLRFADTGGTGRGIVLYDHSSDYMSFHSAGSERARIDSSGNLLVGTTSGSGASAPDNSATSSDDGIRLSPSGFIGLGAYQQPSAYLNRIGNDGDIARFNKDGTTVGSIGSTSGKSFITLDPRSAAVTGSGLTGGDGVIFPSDKAGSVSDADISLGGSSTRFKDLYLSGGVYLGGTGAANYLDDYEEGTYTVGFHDDASAGNSSSSTTTGVYTKIGDLVYIRFFEVDIDSTGLTAGNGFFFDLPFVASDTGDTGSVISDNLEFVTGRTMVNSRTSVSISRALLRTCGSSLSDAAVNWEHVNDGVTDLFVSLTYKTSA